LTLVNEPGGRAAQHFLQVWSTSRPEVFLMNASLKFLAAAMAAAGLLSGVAPAADQERTQQQLTTRDQELMTDQERAEHAARMRSAQPAEERDRYRTEHHEAMQERARVEGVTLPDMPPAGRGPGTGMGMGPSGGQGQGTGGGRR